MKLELNLEYWNNSTEEVRQSGGKEFCTSLLCWFSEMSTTCLVGYAKHELFSNMNVEDFFQSSLLW